MPYPLLSAQASFSLGEVQTSKRGQKFAPIQTNAPLYQLTATDEPLFCPFGPGVFKGDGTETRLNLDVRIEGQLYDTIGQLDKQLEKMIKDQYGPLKSSYHPIIHEDGEYGSRLRMKCDTQGMSAAVLWSPKKERLGTVKDNSGEQPSFQ